MLFWEWKGTGREEWECEIEKWMKFWTFDFVFNQKVVFNMKLEHTNARLVTYFI